MKSNNKGKRKILNILCIFIIVIGLAISIVFSSMSVSANTLFNSRYSGGYQSLVEVYDLNKDQETGSSQIANGDARVAAKSLETKLSPFSDNTVDIKVVGKNRLMVTSIKEQYGSNQTNFEHAIEQDGGLLALNSDYKDILFDDSTMTKVKTTGVFDDNKQIKEKIAISDIFGDVNYSPEPDPSGAQKNTPFLNFSEGKKSGYLDKLASSTTAEGENAPTNSQKLTLISSMQTIINNLREYYTLAPKSINQDDYLLSFYKGVIIPAQTVYKSGDDNVKAILDDFFAINYKVKHDDGETIKSGSLIGDKLDFWWENNSNNHTIQGSDVEVVRQLKGIIYGTYDAINTISNHEFSYINSASKYVVDSNSVTKDFNDATGKYHEDFKFSLNQSAPQMKIYTVADTINALIVKDILLANIDPNKTEPFNQNLDSDIFSKNFIMANDEINYLSIKSNDSSSNTYSKKVSFISNQLKVAAKSATIAKTIEASIKQTTSGFSFKVIRTVAFNADVTLLMLIASLVCLLILSIITITYLLFFYRLLGIYTLIIAVTSIVLTIWTPTFFGVAIGIETITLMFVALAIIIDSCVIFIEAFKKHLNVNKRSQIESFKLANKDTTSSIFDLTLLVIVFNIVLFWISSGSLKNLATIAVASSAITFILVIIIFRLLIWLTIKGDVMKKNPLLLPLDTSFLKNNYAIKQKIQLSKVEFKINMLTNKEKLSSKQLLKIKKMDDQKTLLNKLILEKEELFKTKNIAKHKARILKLESKVLKENLQETKTKNPFIKFKHWIMKSVIVSRQISKSYSEAIIQQEPNEVIQKIYESKQINNSLNVSKILILITLVLSIIGSILSMTIGPAYSNDFGKDKTFIIYSENLKSFSNGQYSIVHDKIDEQNKTKAAELEELKNQIMNESSSNSDAKKSIELSAKTLEFVYNNDLTKIFVNKSVAKTSNPVIIYGDDYVISNNSNVGWIQVRFSNRTSLAKNRLLMKKVLFDVNAIWQGGEIENTIDKGILGMDQSPYTAIGQITQILIAMAILLLGLLVYIIIRFKWTYYVALALGVIIIAAITASLIIVFRVPISYELLSTFIGVISFALLSIILMLGKIRSSISSKTKDQLASSFASEIDLKTKFNKSNAELKNKILNIKKTYQLSKNDLTKEMINAKLNKVSKFKFINKFKSLFIIQSKNPEVKILKAKIKMLKKQLKLDIKPISKEIELSKQENNIEFNKLIKENKYMLEVLNETMKYAIKKVLIIGIIYILFALILAITVPSIVGVGLTLLIGIFTTYIFIISTAVPLTISLEKRRIAKKFAYHDFIKTINTSHEEQIVKDIND
ncbi:bifunctional preprotein translocase subunit SecD/SecF [Entomoplasma ellychniae]|uniref:Bifunctional preprotein translocase subunit SecD/SecF n=1 Tax=Entomoplasma ellychniae TaxID=2114 RepID=A0A8E2R077_9MOLU|nr:protein translocase SecDF, variant type [Entomoplasma ellychniae]PPE05065.1 bifunctional preprotein translocase subunit SecD/SecF [Entomoplasma ellychniae]